MRYLGLLSLSFALPIVSAFAEPRSAQTVTVQLANDQSGANANEAIPANGQPYLVETYWGKSVLSQKSGIYATSAQLTAFQQNTVCTIEGYHTPTASHAKVMLDSRRTWVSLAGGPIVNLKDATISCRDS